MLGRYAAGMTAVILLILLPVKYRAFSLASKEENMVISALDNAFMEIGINGEITPEIIEKLISGISGSGISYDIEIEIGILLTGKNEKVLTVLYSEDVLRELEVSGRINVKKCLVTLRAKAINSGTGEKLANMFWTSRIREETLVRGGYVYG